jgi:predicted O-methyltransferase YrrM
MSLGMNFDELVELINSWGSDCLGRFCGSFQGGIYLQQNPKEMANLIILLQHRNIEIENYLEIGCAAGGLTYVIDHFFKPKRIVLVDDEKHIRHKLSQTVLKDISYQKIVGDSQSESTRLQLFNLDLRFDIIFVDGDHSYKGVKKDTINYLPLLKKRGLIIFHDVAEKTCGIKKWVDEMVLDERIDLCLVASFVTNPGGLGIGVYERCTM